MPLLPAAHRAPIVVGAAAWLAALAVAVATRGPGTAGAYAGVAVGALALAALVLRRTEPPPPVATPARGRLAVELAWILAIVVATGWEGMFFHRVAPPPELPGWSTLRWFASRQCAALGLDSAYAVFNPLAYAVLPLLVVLPLTGTRHLGLGRGHRALPIAALACAVPVAVLGVCVLALPGDGGVAAAAALALASILSNTLQNGPFEEFLFRGLLQTRLSLWLGDAWGLLLASLGFGLWHLGLNTGGDPDAWLPALANCVLLQAPIGALLGFLYLRTRNLLAPSLLHVAINVAGQLAG